MSRQPKSKARLSTLVDVRHSQSEWHSHKRKGSSEAGRERVHGAVTEGALKVRRLLLAALAVGALAFGPTLASGPTLANNLLHGSLVHFGGFELLKVRTESLVLWSGDGGRWWVVGGGW